MGLIGGGFGGAGLGGFGFGLPDALEAAGSLTAHFTATGTPLLELPSGSLVARFAATSAADIETAAGSLTAHFGGEITPVLITSVAPPTLTAVSGTLSTGLPVVNLTLTNNEPTIATQAAPYALITRSDGTFVLGASPLFPLACPYGQPVAITDRSAPFGQSVGYTAVVIYADVTSAPSQATKVTTGQAKDTSVLYRRMGWPQQVDTTGELERWLAGIGQMVQVLDSLSNEQIDTAGLIAPGWSQVLDINRCPTYVLPWLGQFLGVRLATNQRDDQQRYAIENPQGFNRGTPAAIVAAAQQFVKNGYAVELFERDTGPYHLRLQIPLAGLAGLSTYESIWLRYASYSTFQPPYPTYASIWAQSELITATVQTAIPGGLVAAIDYV